MLLDTTLPESFKIISNKIRNKAIAFQRKYQWLFGIPTMLLLSTVSLLSDGWLNTAADVVDFLIVLILILSGIRSFLVFRK